MSFVVKHFTIKNTVIHFIMYFHSTWGHTTITSTVCKEYDNKSLDILFYFFLSCQQCLAPPGGRVDQRGMDATSDLHPMM